MRDLADGVWGAVDIRRQFLFRLPLLKTATGKKRSAQVRKEGIFLQVGRENYGNYIKNSIFISSGNEMKMKCVKSHLFKESDDDDDNDDVDGADGDGDGELEF